MNKLKLLIVEGNTKEENVNFGNAGCAPQSQNFKKHLQKKSEKIQKVYIFQCKYPKGLIKFYYVIILFFYTP